MKILILLSFLFYSRLSYSQPNKIYSTAEEAIADLSQKINGTYSGLTLSKKKCSMTVKYYSSMKNISNRTLVNFLVELSDDENSQKVVATLTDNGDLVAPTSEMITGQHLTLPDGTQKFIFGLLSGGNTEKYLSLEVSSEGVSVLARQGYTLDPEAPRILCLNMRIEKHRHK